MSHAESYTSPAPHSVACPTSLAGRRVYLASRFDRRDELRLIAQELEDAGAIVTSRWLASDTAVSTASLPGPQAAQTAEADIADVCSADACISFTEAAESAYQGRGGRHVEFGVAVALGLRLIVIGPREHLFHGLASVEHYHSWSGAREVLLTAADASRAAAA